MSTTAIIIIGLAVAMALGPLMLMQPSKHQKQLAKLRSQALKLGLKVQLQSHQDGMIAVYEKPWPTDSLKKWSGDDWVLDVKSYCHEIHFWHNWDWQTENTAPLECYEMIRQEVKKLPKSVVVLRATKLGIACHWKEAGGEAALNDIDRALTCLSKGLWGAVSK